MMPSKIQIPVLPLIHTDASPDMDFSGMLRPAVRDGWDAEQCAFIGTINHRTFMYTHNRIQCTYMYLRMMYTNLGLGFGASPCFLQQNLR